VKYKTIEYEGKMKRIKFTLILTAIGVLLSGYAAAADYAEDFDDGDAGDLRRWDGFNLVNAGGWITDANGDAFDPGDDGKMRMPEGGQLWVDAGDSSNIYGDGIYKFDVFWEVGQATDIIGLTLLSTGTNDSASNPPRALQIEFGAIAATGCSLYSHEEGADTAKVLIASSDPFDAGTGVGTDLIRLDKWYFTVVISGGGTRAAVYYRDDDRPWRVIPGLENVTLNDTVPSQGYMGFYSNDANKRIDNISYTEPALAILDLDGDGIIDNRGLEGRPYMTQLTAVFGAAPYSWQLIGNTYGLNINGSTGQITGTITGSETETPLTVQVTDNNGDTAQSILKILVDDFGGGYVWDFDDGDGYGWVFGISPIWDIPAAVVDYNQGSFEPGDDGELLIYGQNEDPAPPQPASATAGLDDGYGLHKFGDGIYTIDVRWHNKAIPDARHEMNFLGERAPTEGGFYNQTLGPNPIMVPNGMDRSMMLMVGTSDGAADLKLKYFNKSASNEPGVVAESTIDFWHNNPRPAEELEYRYMIVVFEGKIWVLGARDAGSEVWEIIPGLQAIDISALNLPAEGYLGFHCNDAYRKNFDNISWTPAPDSVQILHVGLPNATEQIPYTGPQLIALFGTEPYTWELVQGAPGLNIDPDTGAISGTPTVAGDFQIVVKVTDAGLETDYDTTTLHVSSKDLMIRSSAVISWNSLYQAEYVVQWSDAPGGPWSDASDTIIGTGGRMQWHDYGGPGRPMPALNDPVKRYYQVIYVGD